MRLVHLLVFLVLVVCVSGRPAKSDSEERRLLKALQPLKRHQRHHDTDKRRSNKNRRPSPHQRSLKEVDYSSGDTGELLKRLASDGVTRQRSSPKKASETPRMPNPSKSNRSTKRQSKKKRKDKKNRKAKRNNNTAVASGRRWTRRSDDSDLSVSGSSKLLGLGVFGDMRKFFDELRTNLPDSSKNELETALSDRLNARANAVEPDQSELEEFPNYQALRSDLSSVAETERRQSRLRSFVSMTDPLRKSRHNQYDPALLWTGLG